MLRARKRRVEGTVEEKEVFEEQTVANALGLSRNVSADLCSHVTSEKASLSHRTLSTVAVLTLILLCFHPRVITTWNYITDVFDSYFLSPHLQCKLGYGFVLFTLCPQELAPYLALRVGAPCPFVKCVNESLGGLTWGSKATDLGEDQCLQPLERGTSWALALLSS